MPARRRSAAALSGSGFTSLPKNTRAISFTVTPVLTLLRAKCCDFRAAFKDFGDWQTVRLGEARNGSRQGRALPGSPPSAPSRRIGPAESRIFCAGCGLSRWLAQAEWSLVPSVCCPAITAARVALSPMILTSSSSTSIWEIARGT